MTAGSGLLDRTGAVKPMGRERQSWWSEAADGFLLPAGGAAEFDAIGSRLRAAAPAADAV
jgi:hypothetical protein